MSVFGPAWHIQSDGHEGLVFGPENFGHDIDANIEDGSVVIMQSTGLIDKNEKEIFEGDIVRGHTKNYQVVFVNAAFRTGCVVHAEVLAGGDEVIGNIYENPELIPTLDDDEA